MFQGFRNFLMRGNVVDLAVAVIIGAAFNGVVDGVIKGLIDPLIAIAVPDNNLAQAFVLGPFKLGLVISAFVNFLMKAAVVYFFIVRPFSHFAAKLAAAPAAPAPPPADVQLLTEIRDLLKERR
jgi:large conductance mechanosensitive channel